MGQQGSSGSCDVPKANVGRAVAAQPIPGGPLSAAKLCFAAAQGDVASVQRLLQQGAGVNAVDYDRRSALHIACADGHLEVVRLLIAQRADVNLEDRWGHTALDEAAHGCAEVKAALVAAGAHGGVAEEPSPTAEDPNFDIPAFARASTDPAQAQVEAATALCCAAAAGSLALVKQLHEQNADLNASDYDGRTALHVASAHGHFELARWLVSMSADVNRQDSFGLTPLSEATHHRHTEIVKILTQKGAESAEMMEVRLQAETGAWAIPLAEVKIEEPLSQTLKSVIYKATWRGTKVVCKTTGSLKMSKSGNSIDLAGKVESVAGGKGTLDEEATAALEELIHELRLLSTIRHPDLVMFLGACIDHSPPLVISEFMDGGDLERYYRTQSRKSGSVWRPSEARLLRWASAVARALAFLHGCSRPIIHRDLKPLNLLLNRSEEVKVTDFGISKLLAPKASGGPLSIQAQPLMSGGVGTWRYMAPEVVRYEQYTDRVDVYSYALILWFMCTGRQPFVEQFGNDAEIVLKEYLKGREPRPDLNAMKCPPAFRQLTEDCWHIKPSSRPSAQECTQRLAALMVETNKEGSHSWFPPGVSKFARAISR